MDDDDMYYANTASRSAAAALLPRAWPKLVLDSGASIHVVGDSKLLSNLRDAPAGMRVEAANGDTLPVTMIGDIQLQSYGFTVPGVHLAPGIKMDLISVRQLTRSGICTWIEGDQAKLYAGPGELVGVAAAAPRNPNGLYVLQSLSVPKTAAAAAAGNCLDLDGEMALVPPPAPEPKHFPWTQFSVALYGLIFWSSILFLP